MLFRSKLSHIKLEAKLRGEKEPFIIIGGPCATFNPEPLAFLADAFVIGEGEEVVDNILDSIEEGFAQKEKRENILLKLTSIEGVYVPRFYQPIKDENGELSLTQAIGNVPKCIRRQWIKELDKYPATSAILSDKTEFENMYIVEVGRGCGRHCRFCMAGYCFRKPKIRNLEALLQLVKNRPNVTKKIGLMGAAVSDYPFLDTLTSEIVNENEMFSIASLRADKLDIKLRSEERRVGKEC